MEFAGELKWKSNTEIHNDIFPEIQADAAISAHLHAVSGSLKLQIIENLVTF